MSHLAVFHRPDTSISSAAGRLPAVVVVVLLLGACAGPAVQQAAPADDSAKAEPAAEVPSVELSGDTFYRLLVAEFARHRGRVDLSVENYMSAVRTTKDAAVAARATRMAMYGRDLDSALEAATLWSEANPASLDARRVRASLLLRSGQVDAAVTGFQELLAESERPAAQTLHLVAEILARERNKKAATEVMERLLADRAEEPAALFAAAQFMARTRNLPRSIELLERLRQVDPKNTQAVMLQARLLQSQGKTPQALEVLSGALAGSPLERKLRVSYAKLLVDAKRFEAARDQFEQLAESTPDDPDIRYALGLLLLQTNHPNKAKVHFARLVKDGPRAQAAYFYLGQIAEANKEIDEALDAYRNVDTGEYHINAQIRVAVLLAERGKLAAARAHLHGISRTDAKDSISLYRAEAELLGDAEQLEEAMSVYGLALEEHPENSELLYARAMLAAKMGRVETLESDLRGILTREPNNADALNALGYTLADRGERYQEAYELIKKALTLEPDNYYILDSMGWVLFRLGRHEESIEYLKRALAIKDDPEIAAHLGEVLWVTGKRKEARAVWDTALKVAPEDKRLLEVIKRFSP